MSRLASGPSSLLFSGFWSSYLGVKQPRPEVNHSPSRAEVKNDWSYNCFPPIYMPSLLWTGKNCAYYYCNLSSHWLTTESSPLSPVALIGQSLQPSYVIGLCPPNHFGSYLNHNSVTLKLEAARSSKTLELGVVTQKTIM